MADITQRGFGIFMGKVFSVLTMFNSLSKQNNIFPLKYFKQSFFSKTILLLFNGTVVLIITFFAKDLVYITKQNCQLLRKFSSFLLQMRERKII